MSENQMAAVSDIPPSRAYYLTHFGRMMNDLRNQLIGLGLFVVSLTLLNQLIERPEILTDPQAYWRMLLFVFAVAFTVYDVIAGEIYVQSRPDTDIPVIGRVRPWRVLALIFLELAMFACNVVIITFPMLVLFGGNQELLRIENIFLLNTAWHLVNFTWYLVEPSRLRDFLRHGGYALLNISLFMAARVLVGEGGALLGGVGRELFVVIGYALIVAMIYAVQVRSYLIDDIRNKYGN